MIGKRKSKSGKTRYWVKVYADGNKEKWVGTYATLAEARSAEAEARLARRKPISKTTADAYTEHYLTRYSDRRKVSSYKRTQKALAKFARDFKGTPLALITRTEAEKWARKNNWRVPAVIALMNSAVEAEECDKNRFAGLFVSGRGRRDLPPLSEADVADLAQIALECHGPTLRTFVLFMAYSGMRPGEIFALEWKDIDFEASRIHIRARYYGSDLDLPKTGRKRVTLTPPARQALIGHRRESNYVFVGAAGNHLSRGTLTRYWTTEKMVKAMVERFGRRIERYELRHFCGHHLYVTLGLPARVAAEQLGHSNEREIIDTYGHGNVGALEEIDRAFEDNVVPLREAK